MDAEIDFAKGGGYKGDAIEEMFKPFTRKHMEYWWHFREVLRASDRAAIWWKRSDNYALADDELRELVALSLLHYAVYTGVAESIAFSKQLEHSLQQPMQSGLLLLEVRRSFKALYSSLYSSFNELCNIVCVVVGCGPVVKRRSNGSPRLVWNYTPKDALRQVSEQPSLRQPLENCRSRLEIRDHLDHYWQIWSSIGPGHFMLDANFRKGYVPLHPDTEVLPTMDAPQRACDDIISCAKDFNLVYHEMAIQGGFLDRYLAAMHWKVDYSGFTPPERPKP